MRENRTSGSEGREFETNRTSLPLLNAVKLKYLLRLRRSGCKQPEPPQLVQKNHFSRCRFVIVMPLSIAPMMPRNP